MGRKSPLACALELGAVKAAAGVFAIVPVRAAFALGDALARAAYALDRRHREVALANLAAVYGGAPEDHRPTARAVFRNFVRVGVEFALLDRIVRARGLEDVVEVHGREHVDAARAGGRGTILFSAHFGNWEAIAAMGQTLGLRLHSVGRALDNPRLDAYLLERRRRHVVSVIPKDQGLVRVARALRDGDAVAMLLDQHAGRKGIDVDFLGRPAKTFRAPAELAYRLGVPMVGGFGVRIDAAPRFRLEFDPPLWPDPSADRDAEVLRLTQAASDAIARRVLAHPEQWNWLHRRWRTPSYSGVPAEARGMHG